MQACTDIVVLPKELHDRVKYIVVYSHQDKAAYSIDVTHVRTTRGAEQLFYRLAMQQFRRHKKPLYGFLCPAMSSGSVCPYGRNCRDIHSTEVGYRERRLWNRPLHSTRSASSSSQVGVSTEGQKILVYTTSGGDQIPHTSVGSLALVLSAVNSRLGTRTTSVVPVPYPSVVLPDALTTTALPQPSYNQQTTLLNDPPTYDSVYSTHRNVLDTTLVPLHPFPHAHAQLTTGRGGTSYSHSNSVALPYPVRPFCAPSPGGTFVWMASPTTTPSAVNSRNMVYGYVAAPPSSANPTPTPPSFSSPAPNSNPATCPHCGNHVNSDMPASAPGVPQDSSPEWANYLPPPQEQSFSGKAGVLGSPASLSKIPEPRATLHLPTELLSALNNCVTSDYCGTLRIPCELTIEVTPSAAADMSTPSSSSRLSGDQCR